MKMVDDLSALVDQVSRVWARGPSFDLEILHSLAGREFIPWWIWRDERVARDVLAEAGLQAIVDGREKGIQRGAPDAEEFAQLEGALKKAGLEKPEIDMLLDARVPDPPLADATICKAGQIYYQTLRELPEEVRIKIYALAIKLLARS